MIFSQRKKIVYSLFAVIVLILAAFLSVAWWVNNEKQKLEAKKADLISQAEQINGRNEFQKEAIFVKVKELEKSNVSFSDEERARLLRVLNSD